MEVHPDDYKRMFGGHDGPGAMAAQVVPEGAMFLPQGGADSAAEEVRFGVGFFFYVFVQKVSIIIHSFIGLPNNSFIRSHNHSFT